jgi:predicted PurR-regulated permease PerM
MDPLKTEGAARHLESRTVLLWMLGGVSLALGWILLPFFGTILWSAVIAVLFAPVYRRLLPRMNGRQNAAALLTLLLALAIVILPLTLIAFALAREAALIYQHLQSGELQPDVLFHGMFTALPGWVTSLLERVGLGDFAVLQRRLAAALAQTNQFVASQALSIGQTTFTLIALLFIGSYLAFFLIRDGDELARAAWHALPLAPEHKRELFGRFSTVIRATVKGTLVVAAIQGTLGGLAFWLLGVRVPLLWGSLMALLSLIPAFGTALVWLPVAIYFLLAGAVWQGLALMAYGALVIGLIDNLLRPLLVGRNAHIPDYVVFITTLGGIAVFGINGFVLGPAIAAMFLAVWHIYGSSWRAPEAP